jgi:lipoate-protein ligase A
MICIISREKDPFFNLAAEEYLLKNYADDIFMLWESSNAVVVGKHQNALAEINYRFVTEHAVPVARRLSGGGTVFHGPGNVNFTFIRNGEPGKLVDFQRFIAPVTGFLHSLGIDAQVGSKHEILAAGKKISGNAEHVFKSRVLHHGTLLYNADLSMLRESIKTIPGKYKDRAVQSNRSSVVNIENLLAHPMTKTEFSEALFEYTRQQFNGSLHTFTASEATSIGTLKVNRYNTWDWVYGWSPDYEYQQTTTAGKIPVAIFLAVHRGRVSQCRLQSSALPEAFMDDVASAITGCAHEFSQVLEIITRTRLDKLAVADRQELAWAFF